MKPSLCRLLALLRKEIIQLFRNPKSCMILVVPPLIQIFVLGYAATFDLRQADFAVIDRDRSASSRALIAKFEAAQVFRRKPAPESDAETAARFVSRDLKFVLVVPPNFARDLSAGKRVPVQFLSDGRNSNSAGTALNYASAIIEAFNRDFAASRNVPAARATLTTRAWFNENFTARYFFVPAILAVVALIDLLLVASLAIAKERDAGTFDQLLVSPLSVWEILLGKAAAIALVGMIQLTCGLALVLFWFEIPLRGSLALLYALFSFLVFAATGLGMLISLQAKTLQHALMTSFFFIVPCVMLSGLITPIENMPKIFQYGSLANPLRHGIEALRLIFLEGAELPDLLPLFAALAVTGTAAFALSLALFRRMVR